MNGAVTALVSGKGGIGKSTLTVCLGKILAARGQKTILVDMNLGMRALDVMTGLEDRVILTITDAGKGTASPEDVLLPCPDSPGLFLLPASQTKTLNDMTDDELKSLFDRLRGLADQILIDTAPGIGEDLRRCIRLADKALLIASQDVVSVRNCDRLRGILEEEGIREVYLVLNRMESTFPEGLSPEEIKDLLPVTPVGFLPEEKPAEGGKLPFLEKGTGRTRLYFICDRLMGTAPGSDPDMSLPNKKDQPSSSEEKSGKTGILKKWKKRFEKG